MLHAPHKHNNGNCLLYNQQNASAQHAVYKNNEDNTQNSIGLGSQNFAHIYVLYKKHT